MPSMNVAAVTMLINRASPLSYMVRLVTGTLACSTTVALY
jgi:hypothetical protein